MNKIIETPAAKITLRQDGILHVHIKVESNFELKHSMEIVEARTRMVKGNIHPILYTSNHFVIPSNEVREYVASDSRSALVSADAFVINSLPQRLMASMYKKINKPVRPTRFFSNEQDALPWLKQYVDSSMLKSAV